MTLRVLPQWPCRVLTVHGRTKGPVELCVNFQIKINLAKFEPVFDIAMFRKRYPYALADLALVSMLLLLLLKCRLKLYSNVRTKVFLTKY